MNIDHLLGAMILKINAYKVHILVFLLVLFTGLTFAHPVALMTDEWITTNQLHQLYAGHQIITNEGKYGLLENGTITEYFVYRSNILGYSLFLPLTALPTMWIIDLTGKHFVFLVLYLWTFVALGIVLMIHLLFREHGYIGKWRWTPMAIAMIFALFFINLLYYFPFGVIGSDAYPEVLALVFSNIFLLALASVLIYEINRTLFERPGYSLFGTAAVLFSSSYFFWATGCKDHILVLPFFCGILLCLLKFQKTEEYWYLPLAFILSGLLAWVRPELALWVFLGGCVVCGLKMLKTWPTQKSISDLLPFLLSPFFTIIGALPFFLNNYLITKNFLYPPMTLYFGESGKIALKSTRLLVRESGSLASSGFLGIIPIDIATNPAGFLLDLFGVFIFPQNGSLGILAVVPLFLIMIVLLIVLLSLRKIHFSTEDWKTLGLMTLLSLSVFIAYLNGLHGLNTSLGITPDIRYLSPMYIPLTLISLIIWKNVNYSTANDEKTLKSIAVFCIFGIPISWVINAVAYSDPSISDHLIVPLNTTFSLTIFFLSFITLLVILGEILMQRQRVISAYLVPLLCTLPFIWQINASFYVSRFIISEGYPFWIPVIRAVTVIFFGNPN